MFIFVYVGPILYLNVYFVSKLFVYISMSTITCGLTTSMDSLRAHSTVIYRKIVSLNVYYLLKKIPHKLLSKFQKL